MNKIKVLYDVVTTMRKKENIKGTLIVNAKKDEVNVFELSNAFEKSNVNGRMKAKVNAEVNCAGKSFKHESSTDFDGEGFHGHHNFMKHMHGQMPMHHHGSNHPDRKFGGPKEGLNKLAFVLGLLNTLKFEEKEDKSGVLTLNLRDVPEDIKNMVHEKIKQGKFHGEHEEQRFEGNNEFKGHHAFMKELHDIISPEIEINIWVSKNSEVEKVLITANGKSQGEEEAHDMSVKAELNLAW
jgi:hypothetical protein